MLQYYKHNEHISYTVVEIKSHPHKARYDEPSDTDSDEDGDPKTKYLNMSGQNSGRNSGNSGNSRLSTIPGKYILHM